MKKKIKNKESFFKRLAIFIVAATMVLGALAIMPSSTAAPVTLLSEGFEGYTSGFPPVGWTQNYLVGTIDWVSTSDASVGSSAAKFYDCSYSGYTTQLATFVFDGSAGGITLGFDHKQDDWYGDQDQLEVWVDNGVTSALIAQYTSSISSYISELYDVDSFITSTANMKIVFEGLVDCGHGIHLDEVIVQDTLMNVLVSEGFEGGPSGFPPAGWTEEVVFYDGTYTGPDWTPESSGSSPSCSPHGGNYMAKFNSGSCSPGDKARLYTDKVDFTGYNDCELTFWMNHDSGYSTCDDRVVIQGSPDGLSWTDLTTISRYVAPVFPPTGWTLVQGPCSPTNDITLSSTYAYDGTYSCRFSSYTSCGSGYDEYLISEQLTTTTGDQTVSFYYRKSYSGSETFSVGWSSTGTDVSTDFTWSSDITDASTTWQQYSKTDLPVGAKYVAIHYKSSWEYYLYVDDFALPGSVTESFEPAGLGWQMHTVDLSAYDDTDPYIGFLGISEYGNNIFIDDVEITGEGAPSNTPPVAVGDSAFTSVDTAVIIDVLANDYDPDFPSNDIDPATVAIVTGVAHGSTGVNPVTGAVTYTPNAGYLGPDSFTYTVDDDFLPPATSNVATVTITISSCPNDVYVDDDYYDGGPNDGHTWGYDAFDNIQDGIDAVCGSTVYVAAGTYTPGGVITITKSLTLRGAQFGNAPDVNGIRVGAESFINVNTQNYVFDISADSVTIDGFKIKTYPTVGVHGPAWMVPYYGVTIYQGIIALNLTDLYIGNNIIDNSPTHGYSDGVVMFLANVTDSTVENNYIESITTYFGGFPLIMLIDGCVGNTIEGNSIDGSAWHGIGSYGNYNNKPGLRVDSGNTIKDNTVKNCANVGIGLSYGSKDNTIEGNTCDGCKCAGGIDLWKAGTGNLVTGNTVKNSIDTQYGLYGAGVNIVGTSDTTVQYNTLILNRLGVNIENAGSTLSTGNIISNCGIDQCYERAININGGSGHTISDNTITNCLTSGTKGGVIHIYDCPDVTIDGNTLIDNGLTGHYATMGIYVKFTYPSSSSERVEIINNDISGMLGINADIQIYDAPYTYIYNNIISDSEDKGIAIFGIDGSPAYTSTGNGVQVVGNTISSTCYPGVQACNAPYTHFYDNTLTHCNYYGGDGTGDFDYASIHIDSGSAHCLIDSNTVSDGINGIQLWSDSCTVTNNNIYDMGLTYADTKTTTDGTYYNSAILYGDMYDVNMPTSATISNNNIYDNYWGLFVIPAYTGTVTAECNYWGHCSGPTHSSNPLGCGDAVSDNVDFLPWLDAAYPGGNCVGGLCADPVYVDDDFTSATPGWNVDHFSTIQVGINRVCIGGTVYVAAGIYNVPANPVAGSRFKNHIWIYKPLSLIGEDPDTTIIDGEKKLAGFQPGGSHDPGPRGTVTISPLYSGTPGAVTVKNFAFVNTTTYEPWNEPHTLVIIQSSAQNGGTQTIENCRFIGRNESPTCEFSLTAWGLRNGKLIVKDNEFSLAGAAICQELPSSNQCEAEITGNYIHDMLYCGIAFSASGTVTQEQLIEGNTIEDCGIGICFSGSNDFTDVEVHHNIIAGNTEYGLASYVTTMVNAECNYWGAPNGPNGGFMDDGTIAAGYGDKVTGNVDVDPWAGVYAAITSSQTSVTTGTSIIFDASDSLAHHLDCTPNTIDEYLWDFDDGFFSMNEQQGHVYHTPGVYDVTLRIRADDLQLYSGFMYGWAHITITVTSPGTSLSANADGHSLGGYETITDESVQLFGLGSGGTPSYSYSWNLGDGRTVNGQNPTVVYENENTYTVTLTVTDSVGATATDTAQVSVYGVDSLVVSINGQCNGIADVPMYLSSSVIGGTAPYSYIWNFGDGTTSNLANPTHTYESEDTYTVTLVVTDSQGKEDSDTTTVTVTKQEEPPVIGEIQGGFGVKATITAGDDPVNWTISVDGHVFFGGEASGTILANAEETVKLPFSLGIGSVDITVTANSVTKEATGFMLGPFIISVQEV